MSTVTISRKGIGGPKTPEGKARSSRNAIKHGLTSREPVLLPHESREAWEQFSHDFVESLHPEGAAELALAEEMALTLWRNRRAPVYQAAMTAQALRDAEHFHQLETRHLSPEARARQLELIRAETVLPAASQLERLLKYEAQLDRKFDRLFRQFFKLEAIREKVSAAGSSASQNPTLTQQRTELSPVSTDPPLAPESPQSKTDKTNSPAIAALQSDKTNSPAPSNPVPPTSEIAQTNKTNSHAMEPAQIASPKSQISNPKAPRPTLGSEANPICGYVRLGGQWIPYGRK